MLQSEQTLLFDAMKTELLEKIRRLEEDRQNIDLTSGTLSSAEIELKTKVRHVMRLMPCVLIPEWSDEMRSKKCKKKNLLGRLERKKKVALVSGKG